MGGGWLVATANRHPMMRATADQTVIPCASTPLQGSVVDHDPELGRYEARFPDRGYIEDRRGRDCASNRVRRLPSHVTSGARETGPRLLISHHATTRDK